jgi:hypothetical protein
VWDIEKEKYIPISEILDELKPYSTPLAEARKSIIEEWSLYDRDINPSVGVCAHAGSFLPLDLPEGLYFEGSVIPTSTQQYDRSRSKPLSLKIGKNSMKVADASSKTPIISIPVVYYVNLSYEQCVCINYIFNKLIDLGVSEGKVNEFKKKVDAIRKRYTKRIKDNLAYLWTAMLSVASQEMGSSPFYPTDELHSSDFILNMMIEYLKTSKDFIWEIHDNKLKKLEQPTNIYTSDDLKQGFKNRKIFPSKLLHMLITHGDQKLLIDPQSRSNKDKDRTSSDIKNLSPIAKDFNIDMPKYLLLSRAEKNILDKYLEPR